MLRLSTALCALTASGVEPKPFPLLLLVADGQAGAKNGPRPETTRCRWWCLHFTGPSWPGCGAPSALWCNPWHDSDVGLRGLDSKTAAWVGVLFSCSRPFNSSRPVRVWSWSSKFPSSCLAISGTTWWCQPSRTAAASSYRDVMGHFRFSIDGWQQCGLTV